MMVITAMIIEAIGMNNLNFKGNFILLTSADLIENQRQK